MRISVIISTYNSPDWLEKVLWGYDCQSADGFEVLVADDGSAEPTTRLIERFKEAGNFPLRHIRHADDGFRKWAIVNRAIIAADGDYLIFTDGDCVPHRDLVATHRAHAERGRFLSGGYCRLPMATSRAISREAITSGAVFSLKWLYRHGYGPSPKWMKIAAPKLGIDRFLNRVTPAKPTFNGNNSSCFASDARAVNGFDTRIRYGGGDREFGYRLVHSGVTSKVIRYSAPCLHLDHPRGYKSAEIRAANMALIEATIREKKTVTGFGIASS